MIGAAVAVSSLVLAACSVSPGEAGSTLAASEGSPQTAQEALDSVGVFREYTNGPVRVERSFYSKTGLEDESLVPEGTDECVVVTVTVYQQSKSRDVSVWSQTETEAGDEIVCR